MLKSRINLFAVLFALPFLTYCSGSGSSEVESPDGFNLVWSDEFDVDGPPDPNNWNFENGFVRNNEHQWYRPDNARVEDGHLIIEAVREENLKNPDYDPDSDSWRENREFIEYTSSSMRTRGQHSWLYGRFEIKARIDTRPGIWPAFWSLGTSGGWPAGGEVDIMEYYRGTILANAAWLSDRGRTPSWDGVKKPISEFEDDWSDKFHVWRMDWDEDFIRLYVDDLLLNEVDLTETINPDGTNPFHHPHYILVNLAIGGHAGGDPSETEFPSRYEVDYVRIYEWAD
ncbi:MAG: glycoside hydrolase family 16 protein [Balneolales bacterium]